MAFRAEVADRISDRIVDVLREELKQGVGPVDLLCGQCLALMGLLRTSHLLNRPPEISLLEVAVSAVLASVMEEERAESLEIPDAPKGSAS